METLSSNILVLSKKGKVLGVSLCPGVEEITELIEDKVGGYVDSLLNERFLGVLSTKENVNLQTLGTHDEVDRRESRRVECPTMILWSLRDDLELLYGDVLGVCEPWTTQQRGRGLDCGHHMAEEVPDELAREIIEFLRE